MKREGQAGVRARIRVDLERARGADAVRGQTEREPARAPVAHGIGTARAFQVNADAGAFAGLAFALHGLLAAILFPLGYWVLRGAP